MGPIIPSRGLRQGDPLSPYLFILCAEGLSALLRKYEDRKCIQGLKVSRHAPSVSHLLFADDSYLFCKADDNSALKMVELLQTFEEASGQQVNYTKSVIMFSPNVAQECKEGVCQIMQMREADDSVTYLGLPNMVGRNKNQVLGFLKERVRQRVQVWKNKWVSQAGREILIKTVAQALPVYAMSIFLLPKEIIKDFERSLSRYWWGIKENSSSGIYWMNWERLSKHRSAGGVGFRDFGDFNLALLGKQGWRLSTQSEKLSSKIYKARYFFDCHFLDSQLGNNPSFVWRSIWEAKQVVREGVRWRVGDGNSIRILGQPWLQNASNPCITTNLQGLDNAIVASLMTLDGSRWDREVIEDLFNQRDQICILIRL